MDLKSFDLLELVDRYNYLAEQYVKLVIDLTPKLDKFGKFRQELQVLSAEFAERGYKAETPEKLKKLIEDEINKRENQDGPKADTSP